MVTPELLQHIREQTARGVVRPAIIQELLANGWRISDIDEAFNSVGSSTPAQQNPSPKHSGLVAAGIVLVILIVLMGIGYWGITNSALLKNNILSSIPFLQDQAVTISTSTAGNAFALVPNQTNGGYSVKGGNNTVPTSGYSGGSSISTSISNFISSIAQTVNPGIQGTPAPVCNSFSISPQSGTSGSAATLSWVTTNASSVTINQGVGTVSPVDQGSEVVYPAGNVTYTATVSNASGSVSCQTSYSANNPDAPSVTFSSNPTRINSGAAVNLNWSSTNTNSCVGSGFTTTGTSGTVTVYPTATQTYSVTCSGPGGSTSQSVTVSVDQPPTPSVTLTANPSSINPGDSSTISWSSTNVTSCFAVGFTASGTSGSVSVTPSQTQTYSITCSGSGGSASQSVTVTVQNQQLAPSCTSFTATPSTIVSGNSTTLAWQTQNATSVSINNGIGSVTPVSSGTQSVSPTQSTTYVATISNATGQVTCSATVTVTQPQPNGPFGAFTIGSNSIPAAKTLDAQFIRKGLSSVLTPSQSDLSGVIAAQNAGLQVSMGMNNNSGGVGVPVTDDNAYKAAFVADLTNYGLHPTIITIQNEEDVLNFWSGTPEQYLHMLSLAVQAAHSKGYKITNGGITSEGLDIAYWHHLWLSGDHAGADAFAQVAFTPQVIQNKKAIIGDIPDSNDPNRPIFANDPIRAAKLIRDETLIAGYRATGIDYVNFHWYEVDADAKIAAVQWLEQTTGLQALSNEMGIFEADPNHITKTLTGVETLHLPVAIWFNTVGQGGDGPNTPLTDTSGTVLLPNGTAFKSFVDQHLSLQDNQSSPLYATTAHTSLLASVITAIKNIWQTLHALW